MKPTTGTREESKAIVKQEGIKVLTPMRAIREKCLDCCAGNSAEVRRCEIYGCTLWPYRMGRGLKSQPSRKSPKHLHNSDEKTTP